MAPSNLAFVGDVGGTNARFALVENGRVVTESVHKSINKEYATIAEAIRAFLSAHGSPKVSRACIAVACPAADDRIKLTNCHWDFSQKALADELGLTQLIMVNDFTALAMGVPMLTPEQYYGLGGGEAQVYQPIGVLGPGTGLGVSGLVWADSHWVALQGEGGHGGFAPGNEKEIEILRLGWEEYKGRLSNERILTGDGLEFLYRALNRIQGTKAEPLTAADITKQAIEQPDSLCREVVTLFCGVLGSVAGNLALTLGAFGGIYIGGGIIPRLGDIVHVSPLRERFESKARFKNYMSRIPIRVITDSVQVALDGAATILNDRK